MIKIQNIQVEVDASFLYGLLAENESDENIARVFKEMSSIEYDHALAFMDKNGLAHSQLPKPSVRARALNIVGKLFGYDYILGVLMDTEKNLSASILSARKKTNTEISISDTAHVSILRNILNSNKNVSGASLARFEKRHRTVGGNALRAAVLGGNDGLISNYCLIMGIAGATNGQKEILLTGLAGLLAGALSMALGEWISVKSSQELSENQMQLELDELETNPAGEEKEIALIYMAKGIEENLARKMASEIIQDKSKALDLLIKEELNLNPEDLKGSAMEAAITSFLLFAVGAIIPVIPFIFLNGYASIILSSILSAIGLFIIGSAITLFTGRSIWYSGFRQVLFGLIAAAITFGIGKWIGVSIAG